MDAGDPFLPFVFKPVPRSFTSSTTIKQINHASGSEAIICSFALLVEATTYEQVTPLLEGLDEMSVLFASEGFWMHGS